LLLENPSTYVEFACSTMDEATFLGEVVRRTGCGLLLDVNNAYVNAVNHGGDAWAFIDALPAAAIGEIHLAGFAEDRDGAGARLLIDHHGAPVDDAVWALYARSVRKLGPVPTLIERDHDVPELPVLEAEAAHARRLLLASTARAEVAA
ncbi:MAG: multinuclear nonheme iron-dependent oxidase, partial [Rubrivivax sp.]